MGLNEKGRATSAVHQEDWMFEKYDAEMKRVG